MQAQNYALDWFSVSGGGGISTGASYSVNCTVGQPVAGPPLTNATFTLFGGFWSLTAPQAPFFSPQIDRIIDVLTTLTVTNTATSQRGTGTVITYQLLAAPAGASIDTSGVINWTPTQAQGPSSNIITTAATDNGQPPLSSTNSFSVIVRGLYAGIDLTNTTNATAAPGGDGSSNLFKYALGIDPASPATDQAALSTSSVSLGGADYLTLTFRRRRNASWLQYIPEVSGDNQVWFSDTGHLLETTIAPKDDQFDIVTVKDQTPALSSSPRFIRLRVVSSP
jgi:hypothetical protein